MTSDPVRIASDQLVAEVAPLGAELQRLAARDGAELLWDGDPAVWSGRAPVLFPIVGALNGDAYRLDGQRYALPRHGFARRSTFEPVEQAEDAVTFRLEASAATRAVYPFEFRLDLSYALDGATLAVTAAVGNRGDAAMPASLGFHPAFRWPLPFGQPRAAHRLVFDQDEPAPVRRLDAAGLLLEAPQPTPIIGDTLPLDDALFAADALILDRPVSRRVTYGADAGPRIAVEFGDFPTLGLWSKPGMGFVCIEPWQGHADPAGFTGDLRDKPGMLTIAPGETRTLTMRVTLLDG